MMVVIVPLSAAALVWSLMSPAAADPITVPVASAEQVASRVGNALASDARAFINWEGGFQYGGAVTADGLAAAAEAFPAAATAGRWLPVLDSYLDRYLLPPTAPGMTACGAHYDYGPANTSQSCAHAMLAPATWPPYNSSLEGTVGDHLGLFPIAYLARHRRSKSGLGEAASAAQDLAVAVNTAEHAIMRYPHRVPAGLPAAGTFARGGGAPQEPATGQNTFLWGDDQFMVRERGTRMLPPPPSAVLGCTHTHSHTLALHSNHCSAAGQLSCSHCRG